MLSRTLARARGSLAPSLSLSPLARLARAYSSAPAPQLKLAVIGSGPSGFYAASRVLQLLPADSPAGANVTVDMYERLPTPYGLARYGVAPDHPEVKNCQHKFDELASDPRFTFLGNVSVGPSPAPSSVMNPHLPHYTYPHALHLPLSDLVPYYNGIIFSYGASLSNPLGVPGSSGAPDALTNVIPALALVSWYNGHPAYADLKVDLSTVSHVDVVGQGNVALDVARMLLQDPARLAKSDIPQSIIDALSASAVKEVRAVGRRGPGQVAFTTKELREMVTLGVKYAGVDAQLMAEATARAKGDRMRTRMLALMEKPVVSDSDKEFMLDFVRSPKKFIGDNSGKVSAVEWGINTLEYTGAKASDAKAVATGETETRQTDLVVESVGYRSEPLQALPFDLRRGRVLNANGRVTDAEGNVLRGAYASGWAARGPVGVIASTMQDAYGLVETLLADYEAGTEVDAPVAEFLPPIPEPGRPEAIERGLKEGKVVDMKAWSRIDAAEQERGKKKGRDEREKFATVEQMLEVL